jgi:hypothetical protein
MIKTASLALATALATVFLAPLPAFAIDNGPCHYCTMEPIVVKGDRKKKAAAAAIKFAQPGATSVKIKRR